MPDVMSVTDACAAKLRELLAAEPAATSEAGLRIDVVPGGCSGFQYRLALDEPRDDDVVVERDGVRVFAAAEHLALVRGASVDHRTDAGVAAFRIDNPNVVYSCGCGSSFELAEGVGSLTT